MTTATIPTFETAVDAVAFMNQLAVTHDWVSVFKDRGWGDAPLELTIIVDGDGQNPKAHITPDVFKQLRADSTIGPNSLMTYKKRSVHDYKTPPAPVRTEPTPNEVAQQVIRELLAEHPDVPARGEFFRSLAKGPWGPIINEDVAQSDSCGREWFVRIKPGGGDAVITGAGRWSFGYNDFIGKPVCVSYPRTDGVEDVDAMRRPEFKAALWAAVEGKLAEVQAEPG
jgi:hypothetical protein